VFSLSVGGSDTTTILSSSHVISLWGRRGRELEEESQLLLQDCR
jgi:hypothetical protein